MPIRLSFGRTHCLSAWCVISKCVCDATNALSTCKYQDPGSIDFQVKHHMPKPKLLPDKKTTGLAHAADVLVDPDPRGKSFCCIDDIKTLGYYDYDWERLSYATTFIISTFGRLVS